MCLADCTMTENILNICFMLNAYPFTEFPKIPATARIDTMRHDQQEKRQGKKSVWVFFFVIYKNSRNANDMFWMSGKHWTQTQARMAAALGVRQRKIERRTGSRRMWGKNDVITFIQRIWEIITAFALVLCRDTPRTIVRDDIIGIVRSLCCHPRRLGCRWDSKYNSDSCSQ